MNMMDGNIKLEAVYDSGEEHDATALFPICKKEDYKKPNAVTLTTEDVQADEELMVKRLKKT